MSNKRFQVIGKEFEISGIGIPHRYKLQGKIKEVIKEYFKDSSLRDISVLEIGCGNGLTTVKILEADKRTNIIAVDNESVMIEQAKKFLKRFINNGRISFKKS